jgi:hypothetical protein
VQVRLWKSSVRLELYIIGLIGIEILLSLYQLFRAGGH